MITKERRTRRTQMGILVLWAGVAAAYLTAPAQADWSPGDPHKMHFPQLPDPTGWDVIATPNPFSGDPSILADDWQCSQTGRVTGIHLWGSWQGDIRGVISTIHVSIYDNVPADPNDPNSFSYPGQLLWQRDFEPTDFTVIDPYGSGQQGWYDPVYGLVYPNDHNDFHQINIENITNAFVQQFGEIYWLEISVTADPVDPALWGWKTSQNHFMDDVVWWIYYTGNAPFWRQLRDPVTAGPLDMAFVITSACSDCRAVCSSPVDQVFPAGLNDNFGNILADPTAVPGAELVPLLNCSFGTKDFDFLTIDTCFGHTFEPLTGPSVIVGASLEIHLRAGLSYQACNDTISLQVIPLSGPSTFAWSRRIGSGPADCQGGPPPSVPGLLPGPWLPPPWVPPPGSDHTFLLDLCDLPNADGSSTDIIPLLKLTDRLDVRVADDTGVDYMTLTVYYCPQQTAPCCVTDAQTGYDPCIAWAADETLAGFFSPQCEKGCPGATLADDIQLEPGAGHDLISYQVYTQARNLYDPGGGQCQTDEPLYTPYTVHTDLWTVARGGICTANDLTAMPDTIIAGASCDCIDVGVVDVSGSDADICLCEPNGGLCTGIILPYGTADTCFVDFFVGVIPGNSGSGVSLADVHQLLGGPALDTFFPVTGMMLFQNCDFLGDTGLPLVPPSFTPQAFATPPVSDARGVLICTCCFCVTDPDCAKCETCDTATGTCVPIPGCCAGPADCPDKCEECVGNVCVPIAGCCEFPSDCPDKCEECVGNVCVPIADCCVTDAECPNCEICDTQTNQCVPDGEPCCCGNGDCEANCAFPDAEDQCRCWEDCAPLPTGDCSDIAGPDVDEDVKCRIFCVKCNPVSPPAPCSTGVPWSVGVEWGGPDYEEWNCGGNLDAGLDATFIAATLIECLNNKVCDSITLETFVDPTCFRVTVRGALYPRVCVDDAGDSPFGCCVGGGGQAGLCWFNPALIEVLLSEEDCNSNGIDDAIDIALERSQDVDHNGIPDECEVVPIPTVSEWELMVMALLALTAGTVLFGRRRRAGEGS